MSTHTQQTKKRRPYLFICILILLIALACIFVQRFAGTDIYNKVSLPSIDFGNENEADGEWCLILVNKWHPLETENEIDLTELSNGQCVDSRIYPQLQKMFDDMRDDGVYPVVASGYRTEQEQQQIYDESMAEYIEKGYSESDAKTETERWVLKTSKIYMPARVDAETEKRIQDTGVAIYKTLGCSGFARVDMFYTTSGEIVFNEVNTIPGFTSHSRYPNMMKGIGLSFAEMLDKLIGLYVK